MVAAYVIVQSNGKANRSGIPLPVFPILLDFDTAFMAAMKQWCPACKVATNPQLASAIGTTTPAAGGLRRHAEPERQLADLRPR